MTRSDFGPEICSSALSVIIVNYNTRVLLQECLSSILRCELEATEVTVVDNHSTDGSGAMVRSGFPAVQLIENSENLGFAKANNQGIRIASGKYVLLLNSDTVVRPGALRSLVEFMESHPAAGGATCRLLNADGTVQACVSKKPGLALLFFRLSGLSELLAGDHIRLLLRKYFGILLGSSVRSYLEPYAAMNPVEVENISGACLMLRRAAIEEVGLLDETFFMYMEDVDYCIRLRNAGWQLYYIPTGEIFHFVGQSSAGRMRNYGLCSYESLFYFYQKHYSPSTLVLMRLAVFLTMCVRWTWNFVCGAFSGSPAYKTNRLDLAKVIQLALHWRRVSGGFRGKCSLPAGLRDSAD